MKPKLIIALFIAVILNYSGFAGEVPIKTARTTAKNYFYQHSDAKYTDIEFDNEFTIKDGDITVYYIFNIKNNGGFIIVSAESNVLPVLGYVLQGNYSENTLPPAFAEMMNIYKAQLLYVIEKNLSATPETEAVWNQYSEYSEKILTGKSSVSPLLSTRWDQNEYYNDDCPADGAGPGGHVYTGCVATAMGQIMKYYHHPRQGTGSNSYTPVTHPEYGVQSANFGTTTYYWALMDNSIVLADTNIAKVLYHAGVSVNMDYAPDGSGGSPVTAISKLKSNFNYAASASFLFRSGYTDLKWKDTLKYELNNSRIVLYSGEGTGGHAFICDGYDESDNFHFNWGWSGDYDGYFTIDDLTPDVYNFNSNQGAGIGITPLTTSAPVSDFNSSARSVCAGNTITFYDQSSNGPNSWNWWFPGGTPSTSTSENPTITYSHPGVYPVILAATNVTNTGNTETGYITVFSSITAAACTPSTSTPDNNFGIGIFNVTFNTINKSTGSTDNDYHYRSATTGYLDFSNSNTTVVNTSTDYTLYVTVGKTNGEDIRGYIDYNNDGDFVDAGETVFIKDNVLNTQSTTVSIPASPTTNTLLRMRVISDTQFNTLNSCFNPDYGQAEDYGIYILGPATSSWKTDAGTTNWATGSNWDNGVPGLYTNITILAGDNQPSIGSDATCGSLTINEDAKLTVSSSYNLCVNGNFSIESSATGTGSYINNGSTIINNGTVKVEKYLTVNRWWYNSTPFISCTSIIFTPVNPTHKLYYYDEAAGAYTQITDNGIPLMPMQGYASKFTDGNKTLTYSVTHNGDINNILNDGALSILVSKGAGNGWNLVANPYTSAINWDAGAGWTKTNVNNSVYFRSNSTFKSYVNGVGSPIGTTGIIPAMQAFWISASANGTLGMNNNVRTHDTLSFYKGDYPVIIRFRAERGDYNDEAVIRFADGATDNFDGDFDAYKLYSPDSCYPQIYTMSADDEELVINAFPVLTIDKSVQFGFKTGIADTFTIKAFDFGYIESTVSIYLEDLQESILTNLRTTPVYKFYSDSVYSNARFIVHFNPFITGKDEISGIDDINIFSADNTIYVDFGNMKCKGEIIVYDMLGQEITRKNIDNNSINTVKIDKAGGCYLVKVMTDNGNNVRKIFVE